MIIFNALSKKILRVKNKKVQDVIKNSDFSSLDANLQERFKEYGFLVPFTDDEEAKASLFNYDQMYDNTLQLTIMPTEECNFRCEYCYETFPTGVLSSANQENLLKWLQKNIHQYKCVKVNWFGGEPLLVSELISELSDKMMRICHTNGIPYMAAITTNGFLLTVDTFKQMLKARVLTYQVTLDGLKEQHDQLRHLKNRGPTFDHILNNLRDIRDLIHSQVFSIQIRTNVTTSMIPHMKEYLELLHHEFGKDKRFSMYFRPVGDWGGDRVKEIKSNLSTDIDYILNVVTNSGYKLNVSPYINLLMDGMCSAGSRNSFVIRASGRVNKCTMLLGENENDIGFINNQGLMELDISRLAKWMHFRTSDTCNQCSKRPSCNERTCPAKHFLLPSAGKCGYENQYMDSVVALLSHMDLIEEI